MASDQISNEELYLELANKYKLEVGTLDQEVARLTIVNRRLVAEIDRLSAQIETAKAGKPAKTAKGDE